MKVGDLVIDNCDRVYFVVGVGTWDGGENMTIKLQSVASDEYGPAWYAKSSFEVLSESRRSCKI